MGIRYQKRITRDDLKANPDTLYVFGDNAQRVGMGGQAGEMRGERNAVGVRTKKAPTSGDGGFFTDDEFDRNVVMIDNDLARVRAHLADGGDVVYPADGIGTGLSELPKRAPRTYSYLVANGLGGGHDE